MGGPFLRRYVLHVPMLAGSQLGPPVSHLHSIPSINLPSREKLPATLHILQAGTPAVRTCSLSCETSGAPRVVWLRVGSQVWGQVQGQGLVHSQGIKVFPGSGSEQVPMLPQGSTPHVVPELPSPISNSYIKPYCSSVQKGPSEVIP